MVNKLFNTDVTISGVVTTVSGAFEQSLTVSGLPVQLEGGGAGSLTDINTTATGPSVTITGVAGVSTITEGNTITISGGQFSPGFKGVLLAVSSGTSLPNATTNALAWDTVLYDTDGFFDLSGNDQRVTIPAGINRVQFSAQIHWNSNDVGGRRIIMRKNDLATVDNDPENGQVMFHWDPSATLTTAEDAYMQGVTPVMRVGEGDYFRLFARQSSGGALDVESGGTWLQMQVLDPLPAPGPNLIGKQAYRGALVTTTTGISTTSAVRLELPWDVVTYDTDSFFGQRDSRFVIPAGVTRVKFTASLFWDDDESLPADGTDRLIEVVEFNDVDTETVNTFFATAQGPGMATGSTEPMNQIVSSPVISTQEGKAYAARIRQKSGGTMPNIISGGNPLLNHFSIQVIEDNEPITFNDFVASSGTFTDSLTISGTPVLDSAVTSLTASGTTLTDNVTLEGLGSVSLHPSGQTIIVSGSPGGGGGTASTLQDAYDNGDGTISTTGGKPLELTGTGELTAVTGTFTAGLTVGGASTRIDNEAITTGSGIFDEVFLAGTPLSLSLDSGFRGAHITTTTGVDVPDNEVVKMPFDKVLFDTDGFFDVDEQGLVIPVGINKVRVAAAVNYEDDSTTFIDTMVSLSIRKIDTSGTETFHSLVRQVAQPATAPSAGRVETVHETLAPMIDVEVGDKIKLNLFNRDSGSSTLSTRAIGDNIGMYLEVLDPVASNQNDISAVSGTFSQSLTISGSPVATSADLEAATEQISISGTSLSYFVPDAPPATGTSFNDEFDQNPFQQLGVDLGVPIDSGKWTLFDPDTVVNEASSLHGVFADGFHLIGSAPVANDTWAGYFQDIPNGDWQIVTRVGMAYDATVTESRVGLFLGDDDLIDNPTTADLATVTLKQFSANQWGASFEEWTDFDSPVVGGDDYQDIREAAPGANEDGIVHHHGLYLKIGFRASDGRIDTGYSIDGINFKDLRAGTAALSFTPTKMGIGVAYSTGDFPGATFRFFRVNQLGGFFRHNPVYGRRIPVSGTVNTLGGGGGSGTVDQGQNILHAQMFS